MQPDNRGRLLEVCSVWFMEVSLAICQNNDQLVFKDNQELTVYCYVSILVSITKQYLEEMANHILNTILHQLTPRCKPIYIYSSSWILEYVQQSICRHSKICWLNQWPNKNDDSMFKLFNTATHLHSQLFQLYTF